ncbi:chemotaxis protein CheW [Microvirga subterranea]|uniref:Chemotaxis protein CheW n=1 Tax=Microvirga subterranea TaxID=186651 RepID=A0A370HHF4_9HYPH|nr:chemotaxis protein CheW [Microvirga subterranea]RDI57338.1 CheW protein [Microvirga subterranea]
MAEAAFSAVAQSFLTVQVGGERFAIPASDVAEVIRPPAVTRVPLGPASLVGVANLRGAVMPVVSLHSLLGVEKKPSANARVVVVDRGAPVGLMIDGVASLDTSGDGDAPARMIDLDALLLRDFGRFARRSRHGQDASANAFREQSDAARDETALVCFVVGNQDFALPLASVHEVVAIPSGITALPQADAVTLGVMALRGHLLPLLSLRALLALHAGGRTGSRARVVVVRIGAGLVGLAVDGMKEILRVPSDDIDPVPAILTRGSAEAQIQGICRLEGGKRLVSILSTEHLVRDQALTEQILSRAENDHAMGTSSDPSEADEQFIVFRLGGEEYGLPVASVDEVVRMPETLARLPKAPDFIEGVMNLRGRVLPVIDQRRRFRFEERGERRRERVVVVRIEHMLAGFVVDGVSEVLRIPQSLLRPTPDLAGGGAQAIDRVANIEIEGRMILLLNPRELLDRAEKDLLAAMDGDNPERPAS